MKKCAFGACAESKGPDQTAYIRSLIRAFAVRCPLPESLDIIDCIIKRFVKYLMNYLTKIFHFFLRYFIPFK